MAVFDHSDHKAIISVVSSSDHPCQLSTCYKIYASGFIHMIDHDAEAAAHLSKLETLVRGCRSGSDSGKPGISKPFAFNWKSKGIKSGTFYCREQGSLFNRYVSVEDLLESGRNPADSLLFLKESDTTARIIFTISRMKDTREEDIVGVQISGFRKIVPVYKKMNVGLLGADLRKHTLAGDLCLEYRTLDASRHSGSGTIQVDESGNFEFPFYDITFSRCCGLLYCVFATVTDGEYDIKIPFPPSPDLWFFEQKNKQLISKKTGLAITGRQDFPDVFEPDGSITITRQSNVLSLQQTLTEGHLGKFLISDENAIIIRNEPDRLKYLAKKKTLTC
jgi:hypothetical protein